MLLLASMAFVCSCDDEDDLSIATGSIITTVTTGSADVTAVSATVYGTVLDLSSQASSSYTVGAYYSTVESSVTSGTKVTGSIDENGTVTAAISGLSSGQTYYYCIFVTLQGKVSYYGSVLSFVTTDSPIATASAASVTAVSATLGGTLTGVSDLLASGDGSLEYGIVISTESDEASVQEGTEMSVSGSTNSFSLTLNGLVPSTTYYYAAYRVLDGSYAYGDVESFTTSDFEMEYVDLGLNAEWATCNVGATTASELGGLYGWGDASGILRTTSVNDYGTASDISDTDYDVCTRFGGRTPTLSDFNELIANTTAEWTTVDGVAGYTFTASNGNSIFLPAAGYREGDDVTGEGELGWYWSGSINANSTDYAYMLNFDSGSASWNSAERYLGLCVRPVLDVSPLYTETGVLFNNRKLLTGDIEGNGNYRLEIYNQWGAGTYDDPGLDPDDVVFSKSISVTFKISGISVEGEYQTYMAFADATWATQNWGYNEDGEGSCIVTGDGEYTLTLSGSGSGLAVFCVDIVGLVTACGSADGITAEIISIDLDASGSGSSVLGDLTVDTSKLAFGAISEDESTLRFEIYNFYGVTASDPAIDPDDVVFSDNMVIAFTISGIDGNLVDGADGTYVAGLEYADSDWYPGFWSGCDKCKYDAVVTGDGTYVVWWENTTGTTSEGVICFCIDIPNLWGDIADTDQVSVTLDGVWLDADIQQAVNADIVDFQNKDGDGTNGRIEIYNEYGNGGTLANGYYNDLLDFTGMMIVDFSISGIDGNLTDSASESYSTELSYAAASWSPSYWGGADYGSATITSDGSYTVYSYLLGECSGTVVWTIELYNLWQDLTDTDKVTVSVDKVTIPGKVLYE